MKYAAIVLGVTWSVAAAAEAPQAVWSTSGFRQPESALYVAAEKTIYVSNLDGSPTEKDGKGFISKLDEQGKIIKLEWATGLNAPKGMGWAQGKLYVADIDQVCQIDTATGAVLRRWNAPGAQMLNDIALEPRSNFKGQTARAYISDTPGNVIWYLADNALSMSVKDEALQSPNGLLVEGEQLVIASWGSMDAETHTEVPGHLKVMGLNEYGIADRFSAVPLGNLDGLEFDGQGGYWVSDWVAGKIFHVDAQGQTAVWLQLEQGPADIGLGPHKTLLVPMMVNGEVRAYALPAP